VKLSFFFFRVYKFAVLNLIESLFFFMIVDDFVMILMVFLKC
jgi:hypothetical protein